MPVGMQLQLSSVHAKYKSVQGQNNNLLKKYVWLKKTSGRTSFGQK